MIFGFGISKVIGKMVFLTTASYPLAILGYFTVVAILFTFLI